MLRAIPESGLPCGFCGRKDTIPQYKRPQDRTKNSTIRLYLTVCRVGWGKTDHGGKRTRARAGVKRTKAKGGVKRTIPIKST